jgi:hypothetical protein
MKIRNEAGTLSTRTPPAHTSRNPEIPLEKKLVSYRSIEKPPQKRRVSGAFSTGMYE